MEIVETEDPFGGFMKETPPVVALKIIGKPAVPYILPGFCSPRRRSARSEWARDRGISRHGRRPGG